MNYCENISEQPRRQDVFLEILEVSGDFIFNPASIEDLDTNYDTECD